MSSASSSFAVPPRRPIGLMVIVLLIDLGLAAAGAVLLSKGLASDDDAQATPVPTEKKSETATTSPEATAAGPAAEAPAVEPEPAPVIVAAAAASPSAAAQASAAAASAVPAARKDNAKQRDDTPIRTSSKSAKAAATTAKSSAQPAGRASDTPVTRPSDTSASSEPRVVTAVPSEPQDPYDAPDTAREIERMAGRSTASFDRCASNFGPAHGTIQIAFQVKPDGRVANAAAVENSTGNTDLASCLVTVVSSWRVSAHQGDAINMVRPFTYP